jgi:hypothetical protein
MHPEGRVRRALRILVRRQTQQPLPDGLSGQRIYCTRDERYGEKSGRRGDQACFRASPPPPRSKS